MAARKTIKVSDVVRIGNDLIAKAETVGERRWLAAMVERVLFDTDNYHGFQFLPSEKTEDGRLKVDYDDSLRHYLYWE